MTPQDASKRAAEICALAPVIPVLVLDDLAHAKPLAQALVKGGLPVLEVTLRTPVALDVIRAMAEVPGGVVGAGTVRDVIALGQDTAGFACHTYRMAARLRPNGRDSDRSQPGFHPAKPCLDGSAWVDSRSNRAGTISNVATDHRGGRIDYHLSGQERVSLPPLGEVEGAWGGGGRK